MASLPGSTEPLRDAGAPDGGTLLWITGQVPPASWLATRRDALIDLLGSTDAGLASSSGCAASGAHRHASDLAAKAALALQRLDAGVLHLCADCGLPVPPDRLDALVTAVRCVPCAGPGTVDTRWCR